MNRAPDISERVCRLLRAGLAARASDWHLDEAKWPAWRVDGVLLILSQEEVITASDLQTVLRAAGSSGMSPSGDAAFGFEGEQFRLSYGPTRQGLSVAIRHVPAHCPALEDLGAPERLPALLHRREGLVLLTGPTGSGKSTTMNACVDHLNRTPEGGSVVILGDPIEYYHEERHCRITHQEYGKDFGSWSRVLERTLRQDPDVVCISELRDPDTVAIAMAAAETGHLVLGTLHNGTAKDAITRMLDTCHDGDREQQRAMLAKTLRAVLAQHLVPAKRGGRVAAFELLVNTDGVANLIQERRFRQIDDEILRGHQHGMVSLDQSLSRLVARGSITPETAIGYARQPGSIGRELAGL